MSPVDQADIAISGVGYYHPEEKISNEELVNTYNIYVDNFNDQYAVDISKNKVAALKKSSAEYIESVSGIKSRYVRDKKNLLDPNVMWPRLPERPDNELSMQAEACVLAARKAMRIANKQASDIDAVILASCHKQRDMPPVSVEVQNELGIEGFAFDMGMACASSTFGIYAAVGTILTGTAKVVLVVCPEIKLGQFDPKDPDSNFIFGEATAAVIIERKESVTAEHSFKICDISLSTSYSNNVRNNRGAYNTCDPEKMFTRDKLFHQNGRLVYKEVTKLVSGLISEQLAKCSMYSSDIKRFWLHQANSKLNRKIISSLTKSKDYDEKRAPEILSEFANVSSAGALIAFSRNHHDLQKGDKSILCAFGAGYSAASILLVKN